MFDGCHVGVVNSMIMLPFFVDVSNSMMYLVCVVVGAHREQFCVGDGRSYRAGAELSQVKQTDSNIQTEEPASLFPLI